MSDGTLRSLGILLALRQRPRPSIVLLDEIEDSLHPLAHGVLLDAIDEASEEFPVVVSTHSPEILNHPTARGERIRVIQWNNGTSQIYDLSENVQANLKPPLTVGQLLRANALWTATEPSTTGAEEDFFKSDKSMAKYVIVPIVEGHGEVEAVPILLRGWLRFRRYRNVEVDLAGPVHGGRKGNHRGRSRPRSWSGGGALRPSGTASSARRHPHPSRCRRRVSARPSPPTCSLEHGPWSHADYPIGVVVAKREYEAWFLAAFPSTRFRRALMEQDSA